MGSHDKQAPPQDQQVPPLERVPMGDHVSVASSPPMVDGYIRSTFPNLAQAINLQAKAVTSQVQALTARVKQELGPHVPHHSSTMASRLRDFSSINLPVFFGSKEDEDTQDFLDEVYKILLTMSVTPTEKIELAAY